MIHMHVNFFFSQISIKNCQFGVTNKVKNSNKVKQVESGFGIAFNGASSWSFDNEFARNVVVFALDYSLSSHTSNSKKYVLVLYRETTYDINGIFGFSKQYFTTSFSKQHTKNKYNLLMLILEKYL